MRKVKLADGLVHDAYDTKFENWCDTVCRLQDYETRESDRTAGQVTNEAVTCLSCISGRQRDPDFGLL